MSQYFVKEKHSLQYFKSQETVSNSRVAVGSSHSHCLLRFKLNELVIYCVSYCHRGGELRGKDTSDVNL